MGSIGLESGRYLLALVRCYSGQVDGDCVTKLEKKIKKKEITEKTQDL